MRDTRTRARSPRSAARDISLDAPAGTLSVAAQQMVEIARALATGARVLVMDEPTSSLGREDTRRLFDVIAQLKPTGHAVVYISHFIEEVKEVADRIVVLRDGRVAAAARPASRAGFGDRRRDGRTRRRASCIRARRAGRAKRVLEVDGLGPGIATFTLHRGEILGIAGLLGAGRTRLLRSVFGLEPVRSGRVSVGALERASAPAATSGRAASAWSARIARAKGSRWACRSPTT